MDRLLSPKQLNSPGKTFSCKKNVFYRRPGSRFFLVFALSMIFLLFSSQTGDAQAGKDQGTRGPNDIVLTLPDIMPLAYIENSQNKGILVNLADAMNTYYQNKGVELNGKIQKGKVILSGIHPFQRSINNLASGAADFHIPFLVNPVIKIEEVERVNKFTYSSAIVFYVVFAVYARKDFANEIHAFESQMGKKLSELSSRDDYAKFDDFLRQKKRTIGGDRAHTNFYLFRTTPMNSNINGLTMVVNNRIDAYIHNMDECDLELKNSKFDTSKMEKINFKKFEVRMLVSADQKGKPIDEIISKIIWGLQGRKMADVPLSNFPFSGANKEIPYNQYQQSSAFKKSEYYKIVSQIFDPIFVSKLPQ